MGKGGFGSPGTRDAIVGTEWRTTDLWIRRTFRADKADSALTAFRLHHDEDAEVYLNGQQVARFAGFITDYTLVLAEAISKALVAGENTLAIHCRNAAGGQFVDVGIEVGIEMGQP